MTEQERESAEQQQREVLEQAEGAAEPPASRPAEQADVPTPTNPTQPMPEVEGAPPHPFVYAIGTLEPRFPTLAAEKEFAQTTGRAEGTAGLTDREAVRSVLSDRANRYLVRQLCFVMTIQGLETYILQPRDPADLDLLVEAIRPAPRPTDVDVVIGLRGPIAPPEMCNGLMVPIVVFDQLYSFDVDSLIEGIPRPEDTPEDQEERFRAAAEELYYTIVQVADNSGATDEHRALNYLTVRYDRIYAKTAEMFEQNASLSRVEVRPSRLSSTRRIVDVIFTYTYRETDVDEKHFVRVDVTEPFPFLVTKMSPYYDR
jgi:hypothetical protein